MRTALLLTVFLLCFSNAYSQSENRKASQIEIHTTPSTLIDFTPRLRVGIEYLTVSKWAFVMDLGIGYFYDNPLGLFGLDFGKNYLLAEIRPEFKYYFLKGKYSSHFLAAEPFLISVTSTMEDTYFHETSETIIQFDQAKYHKSKYGVVLKYGMKTIPQNGLSSELYLGFGYGRRNIWYTDVQNPQPEPGPIFYEWIPPFNKFTGPSDLFQIALGFKIGFLWKK